MLKYSLEKDGITQGLLSTWQACRQKAKWYLEGWSLRSTSMGLTYGEVGHEVLEMAYEDIRTKHLKTIPSVQQIKTYISKVEKLWIADHPRCNAKSLEFLELSLLIAEATLPLYFEYWEKDLKEMHWEELEHEFKVPYELSLEITYHFPIRGKMDGIFYSRDSKLWLFESKFKSRIEEGDLVDTLSFEFQVSLYLWALWKTKKIVPAGVLYNIVRRIGLRQGIKEGIIQFAKRCVEDIKSRPEFYFIRLEVNVTKKELEIFDLELKDMLTDFIKWWKGLSGHYKNTGLCIDKYGSCSYLPLCSGQRFNLYSKREKIFRELEDY